MASIGKLAKPAWIPMSAKEWDMLDEAHQRKLISEGRTSASLPQPAPKPVAQPPVEIHSPKAKALLAEAARVPIPREARAAALPAVLARRDLAHWPSVAMPRRFGDRLAVIFAGMSGRILPRA